nr:RHS repeat-associated core domain-containing protein [Streptomyces sp. SID8354]
MSLSAARSHGARPPLLAHYYDPDSARHLSPDPLGLEPAPNHHAYVDNPLRWLDPLGLAKKITRIYDDKDYKKHGASANSLGGQEISRAPSDGQAALEEGWDDQQHQEAVGIAAACVRPCREGHRRAE